MLPLLLSFDFNLPRGLDRSFLKKSSIFIAFFKRYLLLSKGLGQCNISCILAAFKKAFDTRRPSFVSCSMPRLMSSVIVKKKKSRDYFGRSHIHFNGSIVGRVSSMTIGNERHRNLAAWRIVSS